MGYSTEFNLDVYEGKQSIYEILSEETDFEGLDYAIDKNGETLDKAKWYSHEEDMKSLSLKYPKVTFILDGKGEKAEDIWKKYFKNGKIQECYAKLVFEKYDESKLR